MTGPKPAKIVASLQSLARSRGDNPNLLLNRFGLERFLYRLGISDHAHAFYLKGALLFDLWYDTPHRPTRDADLLGFGPADSEHLLGIFRDIIAIKVEDGIRFDPASLAVRAIREENNYGGVRARLIGHLGTARCNLQIDVGFGDTVTPNPQVAELPALLAEFPAPRLKTYPVYTVISEKYQAMVAMGLYNSRMKDFFDIFTIATRTDLEGQVLVRAIAATFARRSTALPEAVPIALTAAFARDAGKQLQWNQFLARHSLTALVLDDVIATLYDFLWPATLAASRSVTQDARWDAGNRLWKAN